jgi:hypothetical protein
MKVTKHSGYVVIIYFFIFQDFFGHNSVYRLIAICVHVGRSSTSGHYVAYCLRPTSRKNIRAATAMTVNSKMSSSREKDDVGCDDDLFDTWFV